MTVRRTINLLAEEGVVSTAKGRGTFVNALELGRAVFDLQGLQGLFSWGWFICRSDHLHFTTRVGISDE